MTVTGERAFAEISICRWISDRAFHALMSMAVYCGRQHGCSCFRFTPGKVLSSLENIDSILTILSQELDPDTYSIIEDLVRKLLRRHQVLTITGITEKGYYIVRVKGRKPIELIKDYVEENNVFVTNNNTILVKPYVLVDIVRIFEANGYTIDDYVGFIQGSKRLVEDGIELLIELRDYQREAISKWVLNNMRGVISLPTGAGKTIIGLEAIRRLNTPSLIVTYTKEQLFQWWEKIVRYTSIPRTLIGLFYSDKKEVKPVTIATYSSVVRNIGKLYNKYGLLIVDEAHHLPANTFRRIARFIAAPYRLGLSATPYRDDGLHVELFRLMGGLVYSLSAKELVQKGYLAPFKIIPVYVQLEGSEFNLYNNLYRKFMKLSHGSTIDELVAAARNSEKAREALSLISSLRRLVATSNNKVAKVREIVGRELAEGSRVLVFTEYVDFAEKLSRILGVPALTSRLDSTRRKMFIDLFRRGNIRALVLTSVGDEGLDLPEADVGVMVSTSVSRRQFIQRLGRLLRPAVNKEARLYILIAKGTFEERQYKRKILPSLSMLMGALQE